MSHLPWIGGTPPCYPPSSQVARYRRCHSYGLSCRSAGRRRAGVARTLSVGGVAGDEAHGLHLVERAARSRRRGASRGRPPAGGPGRWRCAAAGRARTARPSAALALGPGGQGAMDGPGRQSAERVAGVTGSRREASKTRPVAVRQSGRPRRSSSAPTTSRRRRQSRRALDFRPDPRRALDVSYSRASCSRSRRAPSVSPGGSVPSR